LQPARVDVGSVKQRVGNLQYHQTVIALVILSFLLMPAAAGALSLTLSTNKPQYTAGETVAISGKVLDEANNPVLGAAISIQVNTPQNTPIHVNLVYSDASGSYSDLFSLASNSPQGQYAIYASASKTGFNTASTESQFLVSQLTTTTTSTSATSQTGQTSQTGRLCLVATATYGSELSPEVAMLRNFRDSRIQNTAAGRVFLIGFNAFYYSFSPAVAQIIYTHEPARAAMRILLFPLVTVLSASSSLYDALSINPEFAVIMAGVFAPTAIGMVYVGPWLLGLRWIRRTNMSRWTRLSRVTLTVSAASLVLLGLAELSQNPMILLLTSSLTVLSFMALGGISASTLALMAAKKISRLKARN